MLPLQSAKQILYYPLTDIIHHFALTFSETGSEKLMK